MKLKSKKLLHHQIIDEKKAPRDYIRLRRTLKNKTQKKIINSIIKDERRHLKMLKKFK